VYVPLFEYPTTRLQNVAQIQQLVAAGSKGGS